MGIITIPPPYTIPPKDDGSGGKKRRRKHLLVSEKASPYPTNTGDLAVRAVGDTSTLTTKVKIEVVDAGALGTCTFKYSTDDGLTWWGREPLTGWDNPLDPGTPWYGPKFLAGGWASGGGCAWVDSNGDKVVDRLLWLYVGSGIGADTNTSVKIYRVNEEQGLYSVAVETTGEAANIGTLHHTINVGYAVSRAWMIGLTARHVAVFYKYTDGTAKYRMVQSRDGGKTWSSPVSCAANLLNYFSWSVRWSALNDGSGIFCCYKEYSGGLWYVKCVDSLDLRTLETPVVVDTLASQPSLGEDGTYGQAVQLLNGRRLVLFKYQDGGWKLKGRITNAAGLWGAYGDTLWTGADSCSVYGLAKTIDGHVIAMAQHSSNGAGVACLIGGDTTWSIVDLGPTSFWTDSWPIANPNGSFTIACGDSAYTNNTLYSSYYPVSYAAGKAISTPANSWSAQVDGIEYMRAQYLF